MSTSPNATSSLIQNAGSLVAFLKQQFFTFYHLGAVNIPFSKIGLGLTNRSMSFYIPRAIMWAAGISCGLHLLREMKCISNHFFIWVQSFVNAPKYLDPVADKIQKFKSDKSREPSSGPA